MIQEVDLTIARTIADARSTVAEWRARGLRVGLIPTMGSLHAGHLALVRRARAENDRVLATIFVNPLQFGPAEDFEAYPRDDGRDFLLLRECGCDAVFAPSVGEMFPDGNGTLDEIPTRVSVRPLTNVLCGRSRPGHFDGVATIVLKLLMIALPDVAYFGEKDYQQLTIVKRLARDLCVPVRITGVPTVREPDGLALSSRNAYLQPAQRAIAPALARILISIRGELERGITTDVALAAGRGRLLAAGFERIDYLALACGRTLSELPSLRPGARLFGAAWLGRTRLIDNIPATPNAEKDSL
jgi:pantoate--beta-alanine ligase